MKKISKPDALHFAYIFPMLLIGCLLLMLTPPRATFAQSLHQLGDHVTRSVPVTLSGNLTKQDSVHRYVFEVKEYTTWNVVVDAFGPRVLIQPKCLLS